jgi:hypothetical protein
MGNLKASLLKNLLYAASHKNGISCFAFELGTRTKARESHQYLSLSHRLPVRPDLQFKWVTA